MRYSTIVEKDDKTLVEIITALEQFATDNNKCFETAQRYFNRIRSTLCAIKKVFQKTTPRSMVQLPEGIHTRVKRMIS